MQQDIQFIDFRVEKLREFLNKHRNCNIEQVIGKNKDNTSFRFIKCLNCKLVYYTGKV